MEYRTVPHTTLSLSELGLGTMTMGWQNDERESHAILDRAFDAGINFIDTADVYSRWVEGNPGGVSERFIGNWLKSKPRDRIVLATKCRGQMWEGPDGEGLSRSHILRACAESLKRLQTDYLDLYQCHSPDENTPIEVTLEAMAELVRDGKVRYLGVSNFPAWLHERANQYAASLGLPKFVCTQPKYNLIWRRDYEAEVGPFCLREGIGCLPYSPLEGGLLSGKYKPGQELPANARHTLNGRAQDKLTPQVARTLTKLAELAGSRGETMTQTALAWLNTKSWVVSPIIGATSLPQLEDSLGAIGKRLSADELVALDDVSDGL
ncbi:aldo/keto reductase [candidate division KSB1 bacterium]|nr:aldo/keto reductase [candidate division KSB1 bacterium]